MCSETSPYSPSSASSREPSGNGIRHILRPAVYGALIILAAGPLFGVLHYAYLWFSTGNSFHLQEALALFVTASMLGAGGGAAYGYFASKSTQSWRRRFATYVCAMEAYLCLGSAIILLMHFFAPKLVSDIPATSLVFHTGLHAYGLVLVCIGTGFAYCVTRFRGAE